MKNNPNWINLEKGANYLNNPVPVQTGKIVGLQNFHNVSPETLKAAGVTHLWSTKAGGAGISPASIGFAHMMSTGGFLSSSPTEAKVKEVAGTLALYDNLLVIDEFFEGSYPQPGSTELIFYRELKRLAELAGKNVRRFGAYAYSDLSVSRNWDIDAGQGRHPDNEYFANLMKPNAIDYLTGSAGGQHLKNMILDNRMQDRGSCIGGYYSFRDEIARGDYFTSLFLNAMLHYNLGDWELLGFQWSKMQSTELPFETWHATPNNSFPTTPYEIRRARTFFEQLLLEGSYDWNDKDFYVNGEIPEGVAVDGWFAGIHLYAGIKEKLQQAGGEIVCCDFTANGDRFSYTGSERLISAKGVKHYNNTYFNKVATEKTYFALVIPATEPEVILFDGYGSPLRKKNVVVHYDGYNFDCGNVPGVALHVS